MRVRILLALLLLSVLAHGSRSIARDRAKAPLPTMQRGNSARLHSTSTTRSGLSKSATDTFYLYGGPNTLEGKFEAADGQTPDRQGWIGVDRTDISLKWRIADFNAATLGGHGSGNLAAWCGLPASDQPGWATAPGYGNDWDERLRFEAVVADPSVGQTVELDFVFHHETEPGYDFFSVEHDSAGSWKSIYSVDGTNKSASGLFPAPGIRLSDVGPATISYAGNDYGGDDGDEIRIRLRFSSDAAWSDEDGLWPTTAGAVQVDDLALTWSGGSQLTDFETGTFDQGWAPVKEPFAGDFSRVWPSFDDEGLDFCRSNHSPVMGFVDAGQEVGNAESTALIPGYPTSTEGQVSPDWSYGVPGGWVVNHEGGLSGDDQNGVWNDVWSPEIEWDVSGTSTDDHPDAVGVQIRLDRWEHLVEENRIATTWYVRSTIDGDSWTPWKTRPGHQYSLTPGWRARVFDATDLVEAAPQKIQVALGVHDLAGLPDLLPGVGATPSPLYDNVSVVKYRVGGPSLSTSTDLLANDGFPPTGSIDVSSPAARDALDVPFDMARDVASWLDPAIDPGDSIVCTVTPVIPGSSVVDVRMVWVLEKNPLFEDTIRDVPSRPKDVNVVATSDRWSGEVLADSSRHPDGRRVQDVFFFDLPDEDFLHPGDVLRYHLRATDDEGRTSTLPSDVSGFVTGEGYDGTFTVRGLPSLRDTGGLQPTTLVWNDLSTTERSQHLLGVLDQLGLVEGVDFDIYTPRVSDRSAGLGSAGGHGATADQLIGYDTIVYLSGGLSRFTLSDGSQSGYNDKSDDLGLLTNWHAQSADRHAVYFGDSLISSIVPPSPGSQAGLDFATDILGVEYLSGNVRDGIDSQTAPRVRPMGELFTSEFVAFGGCPSLNQFDEITAGPNAVRFHGFVDPAGNIYAGLAASVVHDRLIDGHRKVDFTLPVGLLHVRTPLAKEPGNASARSELLRGVFDYFGVPSGSSNPTSVPMIQPVSMTIHPNPFNPRTTIAFEHLPQGAVGSVRIYTLRGKLLRELHHGAFEERHEFVWDGTDRRGATVASGVYLVEGEAGPFRQVRKLALLR